ncbi:uncharacterized protein LOC123037515 [Drosophila rhopaloa]|uniref:Uncharacterized protein n=1 Tax=Drosophila rhopaloa TaxID=1041015 RepID=A0ABM5J6Q1_DRORH|nr:uncharacterized protein LOC123037515 [Drosophila rhopaloa]
MFNVISHYGVISDRWCHCYCKGQSGSDLQINTDSMTNYGVMTMYNCKGKQNQQTRKIKYVINYGVLVLHKCSCNSQVLRIIDLYNYGVVIYCLSYCKLGKENVPNAIRDQENPNKIGFSEVTLSCQRKATEVSPLKQLNFNDLISLTNRQKEKIFITLNTLWKHQMENLTLPTNTLNQNGLITPNNPIKHPMETSTGITDNPQTHQVVSTERPEKIVRRDLNISTNVLKRSMGTAGNPRKKLLLTLQMCNGCAKGLQEYINDARFATLKEKITKLRCQYCYYLKDKPLKWSKCSYKSSFTGHHATCFYPMATKYYLNLCLTGHHCSC